MVRYHRVVAGNAVATALSATARPMIARPLTSLARFVALLAVLAGAFAPPGAAQNEIVLGMSAAFTGASGQLGTELYRGAQAHFAELNARGGIGGRHVRILPYDDEYTPSRTIRNTIRLIEQDRVPLLFGYVGTPTVTRVLPLLKRYEDAGPYLLFPFTGAEPHRVLPYRDFVFNLRASYLQETAGLVDHFVRIGRRRVGIFYQADAYGRSGWDGVRKALARHGLTLSAEATYHRGATYATDMTAQVDALRGSSADVVVAVGAYAACAAFVRDVVDAGWSVPVANLSFVGSESLLELLREEEQRSGRNYTGHLINSQVVPSYEDLRLAGVREYRDLMARHRPAPPAFAATGAVLPPLSFVGFEGFLNARLLTEILRRTGGQTDRASILRAFRSVDRFDLGIDAPVSFGPTRTQGLDTVYYTRVQGERFVPLDDWQPWTR
jgi:ABC-type branched-subunit amino acid transport system substrate-binding protein